jgi:hypothetical protein
MLVWADTVVVLMNKRDRMKYLPAYFADFSAKTQYWPIKDFRKALGKDRSQAQIDELIAVVDLRVKRMLKAQVTSVRGDDAQEESRRGKRTNAPRPSGD